MFRKRRSEPAPITAGEFGDLVRMIMGIDEKLDRILEEMEIDHGGASED